MLKSFVVTGASAVGKSTLLRNMSQFGYKILPSYTTRRARPEEKNGEDYIFLSEAAFLMNVERGGILEEDKSLYYLESTGVYYGTPFFWLAEFLYGDVAGNAMTLSAAEKIWRITDAVWIHLACSEARRGDRLKQRGHTDHEINARLTSGQCLETPKHAIILDTSDSTSLDTAQAVYNLVGK